ncbi:hypothetical protein GH714_032947 [Hevea brasiliensis]|uniref:NB-ARC domain-containing protein n=1 Tax=Hevea brasiliensis TaxID=3981 RepID=A0A6A6M5R6_HEVBR|nr:hypothetical protein GH714_043720 [Hevea brasiliensis]KAF2307878.1 hypothetical protein GH714_032947 [Hevea brasiliensis]
MLLKISTLEGPRFAFFRVRGPAKKDRNLQELPKDIRHMINLRWLSITMKQKDLPTGGIGCLKSLRFLFITDCENLEYLFEDMQGLKKLRTLVVADCRRLMSLP